MTFILKLICVAMSTNRGVSARGENDAGFYVDTANNGPYIEPGQMKMQRPEMASPFPRQIETPNKPQPQNPMQFPFANPRSGQEKKQQNTPAPATGRTDNFQQSSADASKTVTDLQKKLEMDGNFRNTRFMDSIKSNMETFLEFIKRNPEIKEGFNEFISGYAIADPDLTENSGLNSPDPDYIIKIIDQTMSLHEAFKKFAREQLFDIDGHILTNNNKIRISVRRMKVGLGELNNLRRSIYRTKSKSRKSEFLRDYANVLIRLNKPKNEFIRRVAWLKKVQEGLEEKL